MRFVRATIHTVSVLNFLKDPPVGHGTKFIPGKNCLGANVNSTKRNRL
jgi:hypothetical protein